MGTVSYLGFCFFASILIFSSSASLPTGSYFIVDLKSGPDEKQKRLLLLVMRRMQRLLQRVSLLMKVKISATLNPVI